MADAHARWAPVVPTRVAVRPVGAVGAVMSAAAKVAGPEDAEALHTIERPLVVRGRLSQSDRVNEVKKYIPEDLFWSIVLLRLVMPMDVMSYVLGLFTDISWPKYALATALGLTPSAFVLAYVGKLPNAYEVIMFGVGVAVAVGYVMVVRRRHRAAA